MSEPKYTFSMARSKQLTPKYTAQEAKQIQQCKNAIANSIANKALKAELSEVWV